MAKVARSKGQQIAWALVVCGGLALGIRALAQLLDPFDARPFDTATWLAARDEERAAMARDAFRHLPPGTLEADIQPLLGKPGEVIATPKLTSSYPRAAVRTHSYYLGSWSLRYYDSTFLWVHVGVNGRVVAAVIRGG